MNNGPWHVGAAESGGMEDLQTDVMRFMAILAFCLVAVFALVQSLPLQAPPIEGGPVVEAKPAVPAPPVVIGLPPTVASVEAPPPPLPDAPKNRSVHASEPVPRVSVVRQVPAPRPAPPARSASSPENPALVEAVVEAQRQPVPRNDPLEPPPATMAAASPPPQPPLDPAQKPARVGFTLRFATDQTLLDLVSDGTVGLYAIDERSAWRVRTRGQGLLFAQAPKPGQFHAMSGATVPLRIVEALALSVGDTTATMAQFGVTLPRITSEAVAVIVREHTGGDIVIDASGRARLESDS